MYLPLVSVILCNYNYEAYVGQAIRSVLNQTYPNIELVIVDDGSTDNSREVISTYVSSNPGSVTTIFKKNGGQASAFNAGFDRVKGEIICFLDSDDCWVHEKAERVVQAYRQKEYSVVQHNLYVMDEKSNVSKEIHPGTYFSGDVLQAYFIQNHTDFFSSTSGISSLKKHLDQIFPLDECWRICADVAVTRPLPIFGEVLTLKANLGYYRIHGHNTWMNSTSQSRWIENRESYVQYANSKLAEFGLLGGLDFRKSVAYKAWKLQNARSGMRSVLNCADLLLSKIVIKFRLLMLQGLAKKELQ